MDETKLQIAKSLHADGKTTVSEICETLNVSKATLYRNLKLAKAA
jgi:DeoR/GlpR family transcriptional regulator of sugar metabolism